MPHRLAVCLVAAVGLLAPAGAQAQVLTPVGTFDRPIFAAAPPGDGQRLFVVERGGAIRVVRDAAKLAEPFLDLSGIVDTGGEGGLLSLAFPPDYRTSGYFYVFLTPRDSSPNAAPFSPIEVREYRRSSNPDVADPASGRVVLTVPHAENANHYGGTLAFGPDGLLYVSTGDGGGGGDPNGNAQNTSSRLGKLLRLSPRPSGGLPFGVPSSNPFAGGGGDALVFSYGLRNPFRFSFDRGTGDLTIGDVGQNRAEEIDFVPAAAGGGAGLNFQWRACEGPFAYPIVGGGAPCTFGGSAPVHHYLATAGPCGGSITGGVVVRDPGYEALAGRYVYGDFCRGTINRITLATPNAAQDADLGVGVAPFTLAAFAEDACGRVHVVELRATSGRVSRLEDGSPAPCTATVDYPTPIGLPPGIPSPPAGPGGAQPLVLRLSAAGGQRALRRGAVVVKVRCSQACGVRALGRLSVRRRGRPVRLSEVRRRLAGARTATLRLRLSRAGRSTLRRAHRRERRITATVTVRARGGDGRLHETARRVRLVR